MDVASFRLAPMSRAIRILTFVLLAIPVVFVALAAAKRAPLGGVGLLVAAFYAAIWLVARPTRFEADAEGIRIRFPLWTRTLPARSLAGARLLDSATLRRELGLPIRVGVGGLWGGFGWLWSRKRGWIEFYVSRTDGLVWVERRGAIPLLVSPEQPAAFADCVPASPS
jgi:hypothetical protein